MATKITKAEQDALRYLKKVGSVWSITASEDFFGVLCRLRDRGLVVFEPRSNNNGADIRPV